MGRENFLCTSDKSLEWIFPYIIIRRFWINVFLKILDDSPTDNPVLA